MIIAIPEKVDNPVFKTETFPSVTLPITEFALTVIAIRTRVASEFSVKKVFF